MEETKKEVQTYAVLNLSAVDETPAYPKVSANKSGGFIAFGAKNQFPQEIINVNSKSPVNASIIESTVTYICGKGVRDSKPNADSYVGVPNTTENWDDIIEKIAKDYKTFGGFYFQVIVNKGSTTVSLFHQDFSEVRIGKITDTGKPESFYISKDWKKTSGKNAPLELPVWPGSIKNAKKGVAYMFYYWDYVPGLDFYCVPNYYSAFNYIEADGELGVFYKNSINNGFTPSTIMRMSSNPGDDKKQAFQKEVEGAFAGARGASRIIVVWGESMDVKSSIEPFQASNNADVYNNVEEKVFQKIISAHRLASPTLAGVSGSGNLSGNAAEIIDAYVLYNYTVVEKLRRKILDKLNIFTKINGTAELVIDELDVLPKIRETEKTDEEINVDEETTATLSKKDNAVLRYLKKIFGYGSRTN